LKKKNIIILIAVAIILSFYLSSCSLLLPVGEQGDTAETEESQQEIAADDEINGDESGKDSEPSVAEENKQTIEEETPEDIEEEEIKNIIVENPKPDQVISSPLVITGEERGTWFFEACFPVRLIDGNGEEITVYYAQALDEWMTEDFVPFQSEIEFEKPGTDTESLVLEKSNPSGLPENKDEIIIPVRFE